MSGHNDKEAADAPIDLWRAEDEALLRRLEDEEILERLFRHHVGTLGDGSLPHPRAAGMFGFVRRATDGRSALEAAAKGDLAPLARFVEGAPGDDAPAELLHHLALYFSRVAEVLENAAPDAAANAWTRALAAWLALEHEREYLLGLAQAVASRAAFAPDHVTLDRLAELGARALGSSRDLAPAGRAALLALARAEEAARLGAANEETTRRVRMAAMRQRSAAIDAALAVVGDAMDEAMARGDGSPDDLANRGTILRRALDVWAWSGHDEAVEEFAVDRLASVGWELYRARAWDALRSMFAPFRPMIERFAERIERDPSRIAFAAPAAQMFVFLTDIETRPPQKLMLAERAVRLCPTHRNGRLNLASLLCDDALATLRGMVVFARREDIERVEALLARAESLYPSSSDLPEAKAMLDRVRRGRIAL